MFGWLRTGEDLCFSLKPCEAVRIGRECFRQNLQRHLAVELGIGGLIDLPHPAFADEGGDVVMAEAGTDDEGHGLSG